MEEEARCLDALEHVISSVSGGVQALGEEVRQGRTRAETAGVVQGQLRGALERAREEERALHHRLGAPRYHMSLVCCRRLLARLGLHYPMAVRKAMCSPGVCYAATAAVLTRGVCCGQRRPPRREMRAARHSQSCRRRWPMSLRI